MRGRQLAEIRAPRAETSQDNSQQAIEALRRFRRTNVIGAFNITELIAEGRK